MILTIRLDRKYGHCYQLADAPVNNFVYRSLTKIIREYILKICLGVKQCCGSGMFIPDPGS